ncbi:hypothetical protein B0A49_13734, partial [Cryomyces minteri]
NAGRSVAQSINNPGSKPKPFIPVFWSALGSQLRYCGHTPGGYDDVVIQGEQSPEKPSFVAYYTKGDTVVAVASMMKDPYMSQSAEAHEERRHAEQERDPEGSGHFGVHRSYVATNQSSPGHSSNVSNPQAGSVEGQQVNQSRATDSQSSPDTASTANPVSNPEESGLGQQEEGTDPVKQDPKKSDAEKAKRVEQQGNKPLDAADK